MACAESTVTQCAEVLASVALLPGEYAFGDLCADLRGPRNLLHLLRFCWALRRNRRTRRPWSVVQADVAKPRPPPYCVTLLQQTHALYLLVRRRAAPRLRPPGARKMFRGYVPRALARVLRRHGIVGFATDDRTSMRDRAANAIANIWDDLPGTRVVIWYDNFYRARYLANPAKGYSSLNSSVLALLPLREIPPVAPRCAGVPRCGAGPGTYGERRRAVRRPPVRHGGRVR